MRLRLFVSPAALRRIRLQEARRLRRERLMARFERAQAVRREPRASCMHVMAPPRGPRPSFTPPGGRGWLGVLQHTLPLRRWR